VFCGDGEMDEPESLVRSASRTREARTTSFSVVNCNLQRSTAAVRGTQDLQETRRPDFRARRVELIKLIWGFVLDPLFARDVEGGCAHHGGYGRREYQNYKANDGAFVRKEFLRQGPKVLGWFRA